MSIFLLDGHCWAAMFQIHRSMSDGVDQTLTEVDFEMSCTSIVFKGFLLVKAGLREDCSH